MIQGGQRWDEAAGVNPDEEKLVFVWDIAHPVGNFFEIIGECWRLMLAMAVADEWFRRGECVCMF